MIPLCLCCNAFSVEYQDFSSFLSFFFSIFPAQAKNKKEKIFPHRHSFVKKSFTILKKSSSLELLECFC